MLSSRMGSLLRVVTEDDTEIGFVPRCASLVLGERRFLRGLAKDVVGQLLRSADRAEVAQIALVGAPLMLAALRRIDVFLRAERAEPRADGRSTAHADLVFLRTSKRARIAEARVRTGFPNIGRAWNDGLLASPTGHDPWRDIGEDETRAWTQAVLGPLAPRADGTFEVRGHACHEAKGTRVFARDRRFESREQSIEIYFVAPADHPDWRALLATIEAKPDARFRFTAW